MLNQGTADWLEKEARHVKRVRQDIEQLRKEHRKRLLSLLDSNLDPDEVSQLVKVLKLTDEESP